jgi:hypothetical protein
MTEHRAAMDTDLLKRSLGEISADKKKYELWADEGGLPKIPIGVPIERMRREKKKLELEKRLVIEGFLKRMREAEIDPTQFIDTVVRQGLVDAIVNEVTKRIGT